MLLQSVLFCVSSTSLFKVFVAFDRSSDIMIFNVVDFCNNMQCPKDPICYPKMDQANIEMNVKKWKSAGQTPTNSTCQHERTMVFA